MMSKEIFIYYQLLGNSDLVYIVIVFGGLSKKMLVMILLMLDIFICKLVVWDGIIDGVVVGIFVVVVDQISIMLMFYKFGMFCYEDVFWLEVVSDEVKKWIVFVGMVISIV